MLSQPSFAQLPERFYAAERLPQWPSATVLQTHAGACRDLGLDPATFASEVLSRLTGNPASTAPTSWALAYAGHQFGHFVPTLGDGRAHLIGEWRDASGRDFDVQLKGSGRTVYSRGGDGRATLGSVLREYLLSACFRSLGIPTTRSLAMIATGERVVRGVGKPGAILVRAAASHVRVGSFQYYACRGDTDGVRRLADYAIARHDPDLSGLNDQYLRFFGRVVERQARLVAHWMSVGFIHGVMNTDNMTISGETLDYGPCAFLDHYDEAKVFSSIDQQGRYAYGNQPNVAVWNLARLAETLLPLFDAAETRAVDLAQAHLEGFRDHYRTVYLSLFGRKLGLGESRPEDAQLITDLMHLLSEHRVDFTVFFRRLADVLQPTRGGESVSDMFADRRAWSQWAQRWQTRLGLEAANDALPAERLRAVNPVYIARNHLVETAIRAVEEEGDWAPSQQLLDAMATPYAERPDGTALSAIPSPQDIVRQTFCGT